MRWTVGFEDIIPLEPYCTADHLGAGSTAERLGDPGSFPYTRGLPATVIKAALEEDADVIGLSTGAELDFRSR